MCGICGIVDFERAVETGLLERMNRALVHRGPDDAGSFCDGTAGLAMRRLSIIDLAGGHQPISNDDESLWIVFNGEVYNYQELRDELERRGLKFKTHSDTETVLRAYETYGAACLQRLNGMYAFAIWDVRRRQLFVARDRLGVKPLYYALHGGRLRFASETKALLEDASLPRDLDRSAIVAFANFNSLPGAATMFSVIRRLPPAHYATFDASGLRIERYWDVDYSQKRDWKMPELMDAVDALLRDAVRLRMISDVPLGAFLSGGIDSSLVVALMAEQSRHPVETFSIGYGSEGSFFNELEFSEAVAQHVGARRHTLILKSEDLLANVDRVVWHLDEPCGDPAAFLTLALSEFTRRRVTVSLSGVGGDELFAGYRRYLAQKWREHYLRIPALVRNGLLRPVLSLLPEDRLSRLANFSRLAKKFARDADVDARTSWAQTVSYLPQYDGPMFAGDTPGAALSRFDAFDETWARVERWPNAIDQVMYVDLKMYLVDQLLFLQDKMSMAASLEAREPLLDYRLVELAASIPAGMKLRGRELKAILKRLAARYVPRECVYREKKGFVAPVGAWFKGPLRGELEAALSPARVRRRGIYHPDYVEWMKRAFFEAGRDLTVQLYQAFMLEKWFQMFIDGDGARFRGTTATGIPVSPANPTAEPLARPS
ncbi:MAG: asparagine synthase (glutamine-hydrolyzing) [Phycisphaerae bacterium]